MALKTLKPRLARRTTAEPQAKAFGENHQPKSKWGSGRGGRPWRKLRERILIRDKFTCQHCGRVGGSLECDHIKNVAQGGTDDPSNLQTLCKHCHAVKTQREAEAAAYGLTAEQLSTVKKDRGEG